MRPSLSFKPLKTQNQFENTSPIDLLKKWHLIILLYASKLALLASFKCVQFKRIFGS